MNNIAVIITVFNRKEKTLKCLRSLQETLHPHRDRYFVKVFLTDDGCTDGTAQAIRDGGFEIPVEILAGTGSLYWNGGMIHSWKAALADAVDYDGYLWLNDDSEVLPAFWEDLAAVDAYSLKEYGKRGIYVGSTMDPETGKFTYGGFNYVSKFSLLDEFVIPDGKTIRECEACHGNITYVSREVVGSEGIFCEKYIHGAADHDYSYLAHKHGFPVLVLPHYSAACENDHIRKKVAAEPKKTSLKERIAAAGKPTGRNFHNSLLFNRRCFPWRVPIVLLSDGMKILCPGFAHTVYMAFRKK